MDGNKPFLNNISFRFLKFESFNLSLFFNKVIADINISSVLNKWLLSVIWLFLPFLLSEIDNNLLQYLNIPLKLFTL